MRAMTAQEREKPAAEHDLEVLPGAWWAGMGPVGGFLLILAGVGLLLWALLGRSTSSPWLVYQAAKIAAVGLVVTGTTLLARRRTSPRRPEASGQGGPGDE